MLLVIQQNLPPDYFPLTQANQEYEKNSSPSEEKKPTNPELKSIGKRWINAWFKQEYQQKW